MTAVAGEVARESKVAKVETGREWLVSLASKALLPPLPTTLVSVGSPGGGGTDGSSEGAPLPPLMSKAEEEHPTSSPSRKSVLTPFSPCEPSTRSRTLDVVSGVRVFGSSGARSAGGSGTVAVAVMFNDDVTDHARASFWLRFPEQSARCCCCPRCVFVAAR